MLLVTTQNTKRSERSHENCVKLLTNKFYYTGHSTQWMWATSYTSVVVTGYLNQVKDYIGILKGVVGEGSAIMLIISCVVTMEQVSF